MLWTDNNTSSVDIVPATFYLMRHSIELALKDLLWINLENETTSWELKVHDGKASGPAPQPAWLTEIQRTHDLSKILGWVQVDLPSLVEPKWAALVRDIEAHEGGSPEWSRYDKVRSKATGQQLESFGESRLVPLQRLLDDLEVFIREAAEIDDNFGPETKDWSALFDLGLSAQQLTNALFARGLIG